MVGLWTKDSSGERKIATGGLIESVVQTLRPFLSEESKEIDEGMRRKRQWHYPLEAVREIFINALVHRDWTRFVDIEITCYSDRLEVISPGAMQNSMTVEKMVAGQRFPRNTLIVEVLRDFCGIRL
jgi:ATP-dependent DNA helicase RecG